MALNLTRNKKAGVVVGGVTLLVLAGAGAAIASAGDDDHGSDQPITGSALEKAEDAALEETGGGTVVETEADDDESPYEVEVELDDGSQVEVELDENFDVLGTEKDDDSDEGNDS